MFCVRKMLLLLVAIFFASGSLMAQDWPQWRGSDGTNRSSETGLFGKWGDDGPTLKWTAEGLGRGYATVSVADGKIFTSGDIEAPEGEEANWADIGAQQVVAYSLDGKQIWSTRITDGTPKHPYKGSRTTPTYSDGKLFAVSSDGAISCLDAKTGKKQWSRKFKDWDGKMMSTWGFSESPLVDDGKVICTPGGSKGIVVALNVENGEEVWACVLPDYGDEKGVNGKSLLDGAAYSSPVISNGGGVKQYVQMVGRGLLGIRASDGGLLWRYKKVANGIANIPTSIIDGDYVFTSTAYNTGSALLKLKASDDGVDAEEVYWLDGRTFQNKLGGMTLVDGHIYCGHGNGAGLPICLELKTGEIKWGPLRTKGKGKGESSMIYADGHFVWRRQDGFVSLVEANAEKLEVVRSFKPHFQDDNSWAQPVIADGVLYLREQDKLMAYELK